MSHTFTQSDPDTASLDLFGTWIHDPDDPQGTVQQYEYGNANHNSIIEHDKENLLFAGRNFPITEFGEHRNDGISVTIDVPSAADELTVITTLEAFAELKKVITIRDNRGRRIVGVISGFTRNDQAWGTQISFTVMQNYLATEVLH